MKGEERNGWLLFEWGSSLTVAITPSPWDQEVMVTLILPQVEGKEGLHYSSLFPADPAITVEIMQQRFGLNQRRAEHLHQAFIQALDHFYEDDDAPPPRIIPIHPVKT